MDSVLARAAKESPQVVATWMGPDRVDLWKWPNPVWKVWLQIKEALGPKATGLKLSAKQRFFIVESPL